MNQKSLVIAVTAMFAMVATIALANHKHSLKM
jgi:hypothetical protein